MKERNEEKKCNQKVNKENIETTLERKYEVNLIIKININVVNRSSKQKRKKVKEKPEK